MKALVETVVAGLVVVAALVVSVAAKPETFKGTVAAIEKTSMQVKVGDKSLWFDVSDKTKVSRAGKHEVFNNIRVKVGEAVEVLVNDGDAPTHDYRCPMKSDADVVAQAPGKCPKCGMNLRETDKAGKAAEIHFAK